jgi:flagellar biosynthetic protein FlhB
MADSDADREDRQLAPSQRRLEKARSEGQLARSRDVGHAFVLGAALAGVAGFGSWLGQESLAIVRQGLTLTREQALDAGWLAAGLGESFAAALWLLLPACGLLAFAALGAGLIPGGAVLAPGVLAPKAGRIDPLAGLRRILSRDSLVDLARLGVLALALVALAFWFVLDRLPQYVGFASMPIAAALQSVHDGAVAGLAMLAALLLLSALVDVPLQWWRHQRRLRMTHREAREELRESEGDPMLRSRLRSRQREISRGRMLAAVPTADVVITNPSHYAVAVRYDQERMAAPRVVAKGADHLAARIRELALDAGVPLVQAPPLARALHAHVEVDREIPAALYTAVAQVLAYVYRLRAFVPGRDPHPRAPDDLELPPGFDPAEESR